MRIPHRRLRASRGRGDPDASKECFAFISLASEHSRGLSQTVDGLPTVAGVASE
jgi:hypothetical protein